MKKLSIFLFIFLLSLFYMTIEIAKAREGDDNPCTNKGHLEGGGIGAGGCTACNFKVCEVMRG